jgi:hypothetical protein
MIPEALLRHLVCTNTTFSGMKEVGIAGKVQDQGTREGAR